METSSRSALSIAQVVIAALLPVAVLALFSSSSGLWTVAALVIVTVFALLHRGLYFLLIANAFVAAVPAVLGGDVSGVYVVGCLILAIGVSAVILLRGSTAASGLSESMAKGLRIIAFSLIAMGVLSATLALVSMRQNDSVFTSAQEEAATEFADAPEVVGVDDGTSPVVGNLAAATQSPGQEAEELPGEVVAGLEFRRPGSTKRPVSDTTIYVREGVSDAVLALGPGHYPSTATLGQPGNAAVAGHRTGYGSPFLHLDELQAGDVVTVRSPDGSSIDYAVTGSRLVDPDADWVLQSREPGRSLTLTTCDPPHTNDRRLVVFAEVVADSRPVLL